MPYLQKCWVSCLDCEKILFLTRRQETLLYQTFLTILRVHTFFLRGAFVYIASGRDTFLYCEKIEFDSLDLHNETESDTGLLIDRTRKFMLLSGSWLIMELLAPVTIDILISQLMQERRMLPMCLTYKWRTRGKYTHFYKCWIVFIFTIRWSRTKRQRVIMPQLIY